MLLTAQMEVYPLLSTNLAADLGFICSVITHHFIKFQAAYAICDKGDKLKAHFASQLASQSAGLSAAGVTMPKARPTASKNCNKISTAFLTQVCHQLTKVQMQRDQWQKSAKEEACQQGKPKEFISRLQWYDFSGCQRKYEF